MKACINLIIVYIFTFLLSNTYSETSICNECTKFFTSNPAEHIDLSSQKCIGIDSEIWKEAKFNILISKQQWRKALQIGFTLVGHKTNESIWSKIIICHIELEKWRELEEFCQQIVCVNSNESESLLNYFSGVACLNQIDWYNKRTLAKQCQNYFKKSNQTSTKGLVELHLYELEILKSEYLISTIKKELSNYDRSDLLLNRICAHASRLRHEEPDLVNKVLKFSSVEGIGNFREITICAILHAYQTEDYVGVCQFKNFIYSIKNTTSGNLLGSILFHSQCEMEIYKQALITWNKFSNTHSKKNQLNSYWLLYLFQKTNINGEGMNVLNHVDHQYSIDPLVYEYITLRDKLKVNNTSVVLEHITDDMAKSDFYFSFLYHFLLTNEGTMDDKIQHISLEYLNEFYKNSHFIRDVNSWLLTADLTLAQLADADHDNKRLRRFVTRVIDSNLSIKQKHQVYMFVYLCLVSYENDNNCSGIYTSPFMSLLNHSKKLQSCLFTQVMSMAHTLELNDKDVKKWIYNVQNSQYSDIEANAILIKVTKSWVNDTTTKISDKEKLVCISKLFNHVNTCQLHNYHDLTPLIVKASTLIDNEYYKKEQFKHLDMRFVSPSTETLQQLDIIEHIIYTTLKSQSYQTLILESSPSQQKTELYFILAKIYFIKGFYGQTYSLLNAYGEQMMRFVRPHVFYDFLFHASLQTKTVPVSKGILVEWSQNTESDHELFYVHSLFNNMIDQSGVMTEEQKRHSKIFHLKQMYRLESLREYPEYWQVVMSYALSKERSYTKQEERNEKMAGFYSRVSLSAQKVKDSVMRDVLICFFNARLCLCHLGKLTNVFTKDQDNVKKQQIRQYEILMRNYYELLKERVEPLCFKDTANKLLEYVTENE
ncbi:hypothetical protein N9N03_01395 [Chlamydiia bacterium]|nr:hypothetical protein [Chlamydiia bacterium]